MAQQDINIGVANAGNGDTLFDAFTKVQSNFTELYSDDAGDVNSVTGSGGLTASPTTGAVVVSLDDDSITYAKLGAEFTTSSVIAPSANVDMSFSAAQVFTMTSSIAVDINFTNAEIGQVKDLIVTDSGGTSSLTFDTTSNTITTIQGTYSATAGAVNFIQVVCTAANTFFLSISQSI